jgi:penicillin-binding protein 1A
MRFAAAAPVRPLCVSQPSVCGEGPRHAAGPKMPDDQHEKRHRRNRPILAAAGNDAPSLTLLQGGSKPPGQPTARERERTRPKRPRLHKLRFAVVLFGLGLLALISTVFGMLMAVAQDLPSLETTNEFRASRNSELFDHSGQHRIAVLTGNENRILIRSTDISPNIKHAVVAIEDERFYEHKGIDYRGIARALWADVRRQRSVQGGSTITQQFVKNALLAQTDRSLFQKLKEAALAYQLERKWTKDKILTQYLNTVYFGEGAYGVESAARVYFGWNHPDCEPHCASTLAPAEAALLAGMIASPSSYSPVQNPVAALNRRNLVLDKMFEQGLIGSGEHRLARQQALPPRSLIKTPRKISNYPYYTSWVEQQLVDRYGTGRTFGGGLHVRTTLDYDYQLAAQQAVNRIAGLGPSVALVALDNKTGGVRAMVGGNDFHKSAFNLATQGHRQPGSAFKPFTLVAALEKGISPAQTFVSAPKKIACSGGEFKVENYEDRYLGTASLAAATTVSDNSVYAEVGCKQVGTSKVAEVARQMGIRTRLSRNPAMVLGGLRVGLTPLELAHAYVTLAHGGERVSGTMSAYKDGPVAYTGVEGAGIDDKNKTKTKRVVDQSVATQATQILQTVISSGTGKAAQIDEFAAGKTGTTEHYQDALFVGFTDTMTVAVWMGYPNGGRAMDYEYHGEPVAGGTYPAEIWHDFMLSVAKIRDVRDAGKKKGDEETAPTLTPVTTVPSDSAAPSGKTKKRTTERRSTARGRNRTPAPEPTPEPAPAPGQTPTPADGQPPPPPPDGGSGGSGTGGGSPTQP